MKKFFLFLALAISSSAFGQTLVKTYDTSNTFRFIPKVFAYQEKPCIYLNQESDQSIMKDFVIFDENFEVIKRISTLEVESVDFYDFDTFAHETQFYLSQTLFNNDEKFEYITLIENESGNCSGLQIRSETGEVLSTVTFNNAFSWCNLQVFKIKSKMYLFVVGEVAEHEYLTYIYRIDKETSTVQKVKTVEGINIMPRMPKRHEVVTVELDDVSDEAREIQVVNGAGQMVDRIIVPAGQKQVQLNSAHMSPGINIINVKGSDNKAASSQKIFVK
ncbi:MAG: hypothetical protein IJ539_03420 [Prevotella sp.]|nr:hypothetical protein [Prevotella sp.]